MIRYFILVFFCFISLYLFAQSPQKIEADLLKSFTKIVPDKQDNSDVNDQFANKLYNYAIHNPATIGYPFAALKKEHLDINTSDDNLFRIYSWDTCTGGTMHFFESVFQYRSGTRTSAVLDTPKSEGNNVPHYNKVYTFNINGQTYYLAVYLTIGSTKDAGQGIQILTIENGKLNTEVKIIKTRTGLHSNLYYDYDFFSVVDWKVRPAIYFDSLSKTIHIPVVQPDGKVTHQFIIYKFTGKYFEKITV